LRDGAALLGTVPLTAGVAQLPLASLPAGARSLTASYTGDARFAAGQGARTLTVAAVVPTVTITGVSPTPSHFGDPVTVTVSVVSPTGSTPTGDVAMGGGGTADVVGRAPVVNGVAAVAVTGLTVAHTILTAHYLGDGDHAAAYSPMAHDADLTWHTVDPATYPIVVTTEPGSTT